MNLNSRVMIVEDNKMHQEVLKSHLIKIGFWDITIVDNGVDAMELWETSRYDLIFMDIALKDSYEAEDAEDEFDSLDGLDVVKKIRDKEKNSNYHSIIVVYSATSYDLAITEASNAGVDYFLNKPAKKKDVDFMLDSIAEDFGSYKT